MMFKNKKAQVGLDLAKSIMVTLLVLAVIGVAIIIALSNLKNSTGLTTNSLDYNYTQNIMNNVSSGTSSFFSNSGTWLTILAVVVLLMIIAVIIGVVTNFQARKGL